MIRLHTVTFALSLALVVAACEGDPDAEGASDTNETGATGAPVDPACVQPEGWIGGTISVQLGESPAQGTGDTIAVTADCVVDDARQEDETASVHLTCTHADGVDVPMHVGADVPTDFAVDFDGLTEATLYAYVRAPAHHEVGGKGFSLHDRATGALVLAGVADESYSLGHLSPVSVDSVESKCEPYYKDEYSDGSLRLALEFSAYDESVVLYDSTRGSLATEKRSYDIIVGAAVAHHCLNCGDEYAWVLGGSSKGG